MATTDSKNIKQIVLVTVSGADRPGITSDLTEILAQSGATILDIGQAVIHGLLSLSILFELDSHDAAEKTTIKDLLFKATELGMKLDFQAMNPDEFKDRHVEGQSYRYALTLVADPVGAGAVHEATKILKKYKLNITQIQRLSQDHFGCIEFIASSTDELDQAEMKKELLGISRSHAVDIALQSEGLFRRAKRLVVLDMDSTLIENEVIDEFARQIGKFDEVSAITEEAMRGEIDFDESLKKRCALLKGLKESDVDTVFDRIKLTPGAEDMIKVLRKLGFKIALISGGFTCVAERFRDKLGIDYAYANRLVFKDGVCTGDVHPPIVNAMRKADLLEVIAQQEKIQTDQVIAIGDGANDLLMLERAGLGIAFNAKPVVSAQADFSLNQRNLKAILYILGISGREFSQVLSN